MKERHALISTHHACFKRGNKMNKSIIILREKIGKFAIIRFSSRMYAKVWSKIRGVKS